MNPDDRGTFKSDSELDKLWQARQRLAFWVSERISPTVGWGPGNVEERIARWTEIVEMHQNAIEAKNDKPSE